MADVSGTAKQLSRVLVVRYGEQVYGLPVDRVRRIVSSMSLWPVAGWARALVGLGRFGGEPLAVVSLESLATGRPPSWRGRSTVVVVRLHGGDDLGLAVDEAQDLVDLNCEKSEAGCSGGMSKGQTSDGRAVWCVDLDILERKSS